MGESGSFPNLESDDPQALNQVAADDEPEVVEAVEDDLAPIVEAEVPSGDESEAATTGGFDKFRSTAQAAAGWSLGKAGSAAAQAAALARSYPRASLASGLSALVLGGVLASTPSKKPPTNEIPGPAPVGAVDPESVDPKSKVKPDDPEQIAQVDPAPADDQTGATPDPDADASKSQAGDQTASSEPSIPPGPDPKIAEDRLTSSDPPADPAPKFDVHSSSAPNEQEPPPMENVKLTAGVGEPPLPEMPEIGPGADGLMNLDPSHEPATPAPAIIAATGLGAAYELAKADVQPGEPPHVEAAAPAPILNPSEPAAQSLTPGGPGPEAAPAPEFPTATPAPEATPVETPAPSLGPEAVPAHTAAAETTPLLPLPAPGVGTEAAAKGTIGAIGVGMGIGVAAGAAMKSIGDKPAASPPADAPLHPAEPEHALDLSEAPVSTPPVTAPASSTVTAPASIPTATSTPSDLPSFSAVPEAASAAAGGVAASALAAEAEHTPTEEPIRQEPTPIKRSGNIVIRDIGSDGGLEDDPFERRGDADREMSFDVETYTPRGPDAQAAPTASAPKAGKIDTVLHKVESGENFYSISKVYYSSGRYYRALSQANSDKFKRPEDLYVGAVIRVPPPEDLDPAYIDPPSARSASRARESTTAQRPGSSKTASAAGRTGGAPIRRSPRAEVELNLPVSDPDAGRASDDGGRPTSRAVADRLDTDRDAEFESDRGRYEPEAASRSVSTRPVHKVQPDETLRTIARDRLGSGRRADEIFELNRDVIDDPSDLIVGQILELPEDAKVGRPRSRR